MNHLETAIVSDLDKFWNPATARTAALECRSDEEKRANAIVVAEESETDCCQQPYESGPDLPEDLASIDDAFLDRVRALASFI